MNAGRIVDWRKVRRTTTRFGLRHGAGYERGAWRCIQARITSVAIGKELGEETVISVWVEGVRVR